MTLTMTGTSAGVRKAAVLLVQIGQENAAKVLAYMSESEVEAISAEIAWLESLSAGRPRRSSPSSASCPPRSSTSCAAVRTSPGPCSRSPSAPSVPTRS